MNSASADCSSRDVVIDVGNQLATIEPGDVASLLAHV
jgi:hypothetical protein